MARNRVAIQWKNDRRTEMEICKIFIDLTLENYVQHQLSGSNVASES